MRNTADKEADTSLNTRIELESYFRLIRYALRKQTFDQAQRWCDRALKRFPRSPKLRYLQAQVARAAQDWSGAIDCYEGLLRTGVNVQSNILVELADALVEAGRMGEAEARYLAAYGRGNDAALKGYAQVAVRRNQPREALRRWRLALRVLPDDPLVLKALAEHHLVNQEFDEAERVYQRLISSRPQNKAGWFGLARTRQKNGCLERALTAWLRAADEFPRSVLPLRGAVRCYEDLRQYDQAASVYERLMREFPDDVGGFRGAAQLASVMHDYQRARELWSVIRERFSEVPGVLLEYATFLSQHDDPLNSEIDNSLSRILAPQPHHEQATLLFHECAFAARNGSIGESCLIPEEFSDVGLRERALLLKARMRALLGEPDGAAHLLENLTLPSVTAAIRCEASLLLTQLNLIDGDLSRAHEFLLMARADIGYAQNGVSGQIDKIFARYQREAGFVRIGRAPLETDELATLVSTHSNSTPLALSLARSLDREGWLEPLNIRPAEVKGNRLARIPRQIFQFWHAGCVDSDVAKAMETWQTEYDGWEYQLFDHQGAIDFLESQYGNKVVDAYRSCGHPAMAADFFGHTVLLNRGGLFVAADEVCLSAIRWSTQTELVVRFQDDSLLPEFLPGFAAVRPNHPLYENLVDEMIETIRSGHEHDRWFCTGAGLYTRHVVRWLVDNGLLSNSNDLAGQICVIRQSAYRRFAYTPDFAYKGPEEAVFRPA